MSLFSWPREEGSHKDLNQAARIGFNPTCCFAKEAKKWFWENFPLFRGFTWWSPVSNRAAGQDGQTAAADALMQYWQQRPHAGHINSSLCGHGTPRTPFQSQFLSLFPVSYKGALASCPLAQHGCSALPTGNTPSPSWREPLPVF